MKDYLDVSALQPHPGATRSDVWRRLVHCLWGLLASQWSRCWDFSQCLKCRFLERNTCIFGKTGSTQVVNTMQFHTVLCSWALFCWCVFRACPEDNSIIMPDVPNFRERHFEHFQRSAGHASSGETLLYQATGCLGQLDLGWEGVCWYRYSSILMPLGIIGGIQIWEPLMERG